MSNQRETGKIKEKSLKVLLFKREKKNIKKKKKNSEKISKQNVVQRKND